MKWDVSFIRETTKETIWYSEDTELNHACSFVDADSKEEAILLAKEYISELMNCNALCVENRINEIVVFESNEHKIVERYFNFSAQRVYALLNENGVSFFSRVPGAIGGHRRLKIYGRLDCPSALRHIAKGEYVKHRVFFADKETATSAGYRPCGVCMREDYLKWKANQEILKSEK